MNSYETWFIIGSILPILGSAILLLTNYQKSAAEKAEKQAAKNEEAERRRIEGLKYEALLDVHAAAENMKAEYQKRAELLKSPSGPAAASKDLENRAVADAKLGERIAKLFSEAPAAIEARLNKLKTDLEAENATMARARAISNELRPKFEKALAALVSGAKATAAKGHIQIQEITPLRLPARLVFSTGERTDWGTSEGITEIRLTSGEAIQIGVHAGFVPSPTARPPMRLPSPDSDGIEYPGLYVQSSRGSASAKLAYRGVKGVFEATGNNYPEWVALNRDFTSNADALAENLMVVVLAKARIAQALDAATKSQSK